MQPERLTADPAPVVSPPDTTLLLHRARAGDREAFGGIYRLHVDRVYALCLRLCGGDRDEAAQRTQDAFVRAWEKLGTFRGDSRLLTWLHRLTVNVILDHRRAEQRRILTEIGGDLDPDQHARALADRPGDRLDLEAAVAALPAGARTIFVLHDVEGYRLREVAVMCGVALGTAKSQLHRARGLLREALA